MFFCIAGIKDEDSVSEVGGPVGWLVLKIPTRGRDSLTLNGWIFIDIGDIQNYLVGGFTVFGLEGCDLFAYFPNWDVYVVLLSWKNS